VRVDFHTHSHYSDGTLSPTALVLLLKAAEVTRFALTDHDTVDGLPEAASAAAEHGMDLVAGVEISASHGNLAVHIVGLGIDPDCAALKQFLALQQAARHARNEQIDLKLGKARWPGMLERARALAHPGLVTRTHFARALVHAGAAMDMGQVFGRYLTTGKPGYVSASWPTMAAANAVIRAAGGKSVLAHPLRYGLSGGKFRALLEAFKNSNGEAIEVASGAKSSDSLKALTDAAIRYGFKASLGSDFHDPEQRWLKLGRLPALPETLELAV
jgi:3',5'-nucleoside bisphosphate phosphatase